MLHLGDQPASSYLQCLTGINTVGNIFEGILGLEWLVRMKGRLTDEDMGIQALRYAGDWCTAEIPALVAMVRQPIFRDGQLSKWRPILEALVMGVLFTLQEKPELFAAITDPESAYNPLLCQAHLEALRLGHASGLEFYQQNRPVPALVGPGHYVTQAQLGKYSPVNLGMTGTRGFIVSRDTPDAVLRWQAVSVNRQPVCRSAARGSTVSHLGAKALLALRDKRAPPPAATKISALIPPPPAKASPAGPSPALTVGRDVQDASAEVVDDDGIWDGDELSDEEPNNVGLLCEMLGRSTFPASINF
jgi:hypothetical protein